MTKTQLEMLGDRLARAERAHKAGSGGLDSDQVELVTGIVAACQSKGARSELNAVNHIKRGAETFWASLNES